jgi:hypothetical protein
LSRIPLAFRAFFSILFRGQLGADIALALGFQKKAAPAPPPSKATPADGALQLLGILQRESRLVDFLMEDLAGLPDEQVGAAVRPIHEQSRAALARLVKLTPIIDGVEGAYTRLVSVDTSAVRVLGNAPANTTIEGGTLRHKGWRAEKVNLPGLGRGDDAGIVAPAEIEVE